MKLFLQIPFSLAKIHQQQKRNEKKHCHVIFCEMAEPLQNLCRTTVDHAALWSCLTDALVCLLSLLNCLSSTTL